MLNKTEMALPKPTTIPTPSNFPLNWDEFGDEQLYWKHARSHFPRQVPPLTGQFLCLWEEEGHNRGAAAYDRPNRDRVRHINTYLYSASIATRSPDGETAQIRQAQKKLDAAIARLDELWNEEWLPEVKDHLAYWDAFDLAGASMAALLIHLDHTLERMVRVKEIHWLVISPAYLAISQFVDLYGDLFGYDDAFEAYKLLQGFDNMTLEMGRGLWALTHRVLSSSELRYILEATPAIEVPSVLAESPTGRTFLAHLQAYLEAYGQRGDNWGALDEPAWVEEPTPVIKNLKDYLAQPGRDPQTDLAALAAEREQLIGAARNQLRGYPRPVIDQFEALLKAAQVGLIISEDHTFWIDFVPIYKTRRVFLEFGRRFAQSGVINQVDDIFFLRFEEIRETANTAALIDRRALVAARRAEMARFRSVTPPPVLGTEPAPSLTNADDPLNPVWGKMFATPTQDEAEPNLLRGNPGSPGKVCGPAKVLRSIVEADKLQPGDILVTETTAPPWTPLFATAAAVVTDIGGILNHCAVVAREYRIPAVVGANIATLRIQDGQMIEVDGDAGVVRLTAIATS